MNVKNINVITKDVNPVPQNKTKKKNVLLVKPMIL